MGGGKTDWGEPPFPTVGILPNWETLIGPDRARGKSSKAWIQTPCAIMIKTVSPKCLNCPTFRAGKCAGTAKRLVATDTSPITRKDKREGDISSVFTSFSGRKSVPLPERFRDLKRNLTTGFEDRIQKSWDELVEVLKVRTEEVATKRESIIPQLNFSDIQAGNVSPANIAAIRRTGVAVIRGVVDKDVTEKLLSDVRQYLTSRPFKGFPSTSDKKWQEYDPWDLTGRLDANMNMYDAPGGCSVFRTFQSWLGLSRHGPQQGTLVVHPILQPTTAYWMLRPFFKPTRKDSLDGWKFSLDDDEGDIFLHGANPGTAQEHTPTLHPHLRLAETMIPYPTVEPGDTGKTDNDPNELDEANPDQYVKQQREAFLKGVPPPDFPGGSGESQFSDRATIADIQSEAGKVAMGLSPIKLNGKDEKSKKLGQNMNAMLGF
ncbi:similar to An14g07330 [Aspergillus luchuensis]|uniref:Similar to An14g07330 n=1 Tax=Aspergillus kawachii TaxID=1069201 RepID=A0A146EYJ7_ASPKA|nr:similar to An14g07330 [Aspergillus luchuensis]